MKRNTVYAMIFALFLLILAIFGKSALPLFLIAAMAMIVALSLIFAKVFSKRVSVSVALEELAEKEKPLTGVVTVTNSSPWPFPFLGTVVVMENLLTGERVEKTIYHSVPPKGESVKELSFSSQSCGKVRFSAGETLFCDFFGVSHFRCGEGAQAEALILPDMIPLEVTVVKSGVTEPECDQFSPYKSGDDPSETFAIRDYEPGDPLRSIHWKLTGKFDRVVIREASLPVNESVLVLFERVMLPGQEKTAPAVRNALGEIVVSLSQKLTEMNLAHTVGWLSGESGTFIGHRVDSEESFQLMLPEMLAVSELKGRENTIEGYMKTLNPGSYSNMIYISSNAPENLFLLPVTVKKTVILCTEAGEEAGVSGEADFYGVTPENYETALYPLLI